MWPKRSSFAAGVGVTELGNYRQAPASWVVVISDVKGSTQAIEAGRYKDVNALGVASIVALRNAMGGLAVPYVFGGDGATLLLPSSRMAEATMAMQGIRNLARNGFDLEMRTGEVSVGELLDDGFEVLVARFRSSPHVDLAMLAGRGITEAERRIKASDESPPEGASKADFSGFECRWQPIPSRRGHFASLLVQATGDDAASTYRRVLGAISTILGEAAPGRPVAPETLELQRPGDRYDHEARVRSQAASGARYQLRNAVAKVSAMVGTQLMKRQVDALGFPGSTYRDEVVANTDFRKFDDMLRMVIDVTPQQREQIADMLDRERSAATLHYGLHIAATSLMTCAIGDYRGDHVHFVDGADGGYALAAKQLKRQLLEKP